ncbi:MAG: GntR family transcriptional regulator, partial [Aeromicrobium sp.]
MVAEALREAIVDGRFRSGERVKEAPLAEQLGVSRGPIRDALRLLQYDGLVTIVPNRGAIVPDVHAADVLEVYALRAAIGSLALHKLMMEGPVAIRPEIELALVRLRRAVAIGDEQGAAEADLDFQSAIVNAAALTRLSREWGRLTWQVRMFIATLDMHYTDKLPTMLAEVDDLYSAVAAGDAGRAERVWRDKFERWVRDFIQRMPNEDFDVDLWAALTSGNQLRSRDQRLGRPPESSA